MKANKVITTFKIFKVGEEGVTRIEYHEPKWQGDSHYCDVFRDGEKLRVFYPDEITFEEVEE